MKIFDVRDKVKCRFIPRNRPATTATAAVLFAAGFPLPHRHPASLRIAAHYIIHPCGSILWLYDHDKILPAVYGFNHKAIAICVSGNFPRSPGGVDDEHFYKPQQFGKWQFAVSQAKAGRFLLAQLALEYGVREIYAQRQGSRYRPMGPGPDVWGALGEFGRRDLGLDNGAPDFTIGTGRPIPSEWREAYVPWSQRLEGS